MKFIAKTQYGLEKTLAEEIRSLGAEEIVCLNRAVSFTGDLKMMYRANYNLRTAMSVLMVISEFRIRSKDDLYRNAGKTDWRRFLSADGTFSVVPVVTSPLFNHSGYAGLVLKDSIADWFRNKTGARPSVDTVNPGIIFNLHISNDQVTISADSSGLPLYRRGYRREQGSAPMNEVLAAGIILMTGWDGNTALIDPMCGSGTLAVESALIACNIPPGRFRESFAFSKWNNYKPELFDELVQESEMNLVRPHGRIYASDISETAVSQTIANIEAAGVRDIVTVNRINFHDLTAPDEGGIIVMNPPYGERMRILEHDELYGMIGTSLKHRFAGFKAWIISSDKEFLKKTGLKPSVKTVLYNGALECILAKYDLYPGSNKKRSFQVLSHDS